MNQRTYGIFWSVGIAVALLLCPVGAAAQTASAPVQFPQPPRVFAGPNISPSENVTPGVEIINTAKPENATVTAKRKSSYEVRVGAADWVDTGIPLTAGDTLRATATGTLTFSDGHTAQPDGAKAGWRDLLRQYPLPSAPIGALIGRVGGNDAGVPFALGANGNTTAASNGNLFLRANLAQDHGADGEYTVKITFSRAASRPAVNISAANGLANFKSEITPALFAEIPRRVRDAHGNLGDVVNFSLIGTREELARAFTAAGWLPVDKSVGDAILHGLESTMEHKVYLEMPMSTLFLFGRPQDISYARAAPLEVAAVRHHLRVWDSGQKVGGRTLWVGSATHDNGFEKDQRNGNVTHHIDENIDEERDFILASFQQAGVTSVAAYVLPANPVQSARTATGGSFRTDGRIVVMDLK